MAAIRLGLEDVHVRIEVPLVAAAYALTAVVLAVVWLMALVVCLYGVLGILGGRGE